MISILSLLLTISAQVRAEPPRVSTSRDGFLHVILGSAVESALRAADPDFKMLAMTQMDEQVVTLHEAGDQPPFAIVGDFNGDHVPDAVVMGVSGDRLKIYGVVSGPRGYQVRPVADQEFEADGVRVMLTLVADRTHRPAGEDSVVKRFDVDAFYLGTAEANPDLMHLVRDRFVRWQP